MKKFWDQLKPQERRWLAGIGLMIFIVLNYVLVWPQFKEWGKNSTRMRNSEADIVRCRTEIAKKGDYESRIRRFEASGPAVPQEDQIINFERYYDERARENGVNIVNRLGLRARTNNEFFVEQETTIQVQAKEENLVGFLYSLGSSNSLMRVRSMSLQPADLNRYQLAATLGIAASYQRKMPAAPPKAAPKTDSSTTKPTAPVARPTTPTNKPGPSIIKKP